MFISVMIATNGNKPFWKGHKAAALCIDGWLRRKP
jgi:hypothetical protein